MRSLLFNLLLLILMTACTQQSNSILGEWKGKNHSGQDIQWNFESGGKAVSIRGSAVQDMFYMVDNTKDPWHLNLNSTVDTNTLRAIYRFTDTGKLVIGINNELVTRRPSGFDDPGVQKLILTKKEQ